MTYQQKIVPENGGYKGVLLVNGEVVFTSSVCRSLREAAEKIKQQLLTINPPQIATSESQPAAASASFEAPKPPVSPVARCCGRG